MARSLPWVLMLLMTACSAVKMHRIRDDWAQVDKTRIKRLIVVVQPLPDGKPKVAELWATVARRYVNLKRDFLVKSVLTQAEPVDHAKVCTGDLDGLLWLQPTLTAKGDGFESEVQARLLRCTDEVEVWAADAGGSYPSKDPLLTEVTQNYVRELGPEIEPYVAPALDLLRPTLDTLPQPQLTEDDITEKMSLDD